MKKQIVAALTIVALSALIVTFPSGAQAAPGQGQGIGQHGARMNKAADYLGLSDAQRAQMQPILLAVRQQVMAIQSNKSLTPQAKQAKFLELAKSTHQKMQAILTPAQRQKLANLKNHRGGA